MRQFGPVLLLFTSFFASPLSAGEASVECPKSIAFIATEPLNAAAAETFRQIYSELGCDTKFVGVPGRRGIRSFNEGAVDGELFRLKRAEKAYKREFVRSSTPLFTLHNALWLHPDPSIRDKYPQGYLMGILWQEEYMKRRNKSVFHDAEIMHETYRNGRLGGFLGTHYTVRSMASRGRLTPAPTMGKIIVSEPLYHYLSAEYAPLMARFSDIVRERNPFSFINRSTE